MRWRTTRPTSQRGKRYTFQFQGSEGASWKQRRKESSTTADAASCSSGLMSSSSCLPRHNPWSQLDCSMDGLLRLCKMVYWAKVANVCNVQKVGFGLQQRLAGSLEDAVFFCLDIQVLQAQNQSAWPARVSMVPLVHARKWPSMQVATPLSALGKACTSMVFSTSPLDLGEPAL